MRTFVLALGLIAATLTGQTKTDWKIEYKVPAKVSANYDTPLTVMVKDAKGKPVSDAEVETILTMVDMDHGEFKKPAAATKPGEYEAKQNFIMVGKWNIEVKVKKGKDMASKKFVFEVKE